MKRAVDNRDRPGSGWGDVCPDPGLAMMKQAMTQDAAVMQVMGWATHPASPAPILPTTSGLGQSGHPLRKLFF